jgi:predicted AAA+ superfamily ATPase
MAHNRHRHIIEKFRHLRGFSPILGVFGHRQVGKSTLIAQEIPDYRTLDDIETLDFAARSPKEFTTLPRSGTLAIDECQLEPRLFPTLKERVRTNKRPGQYVLSGSVRFTSRKTIRESLAGRMALIELLPLTVAELAKLEFKHTIPDLMKHRSLGADSIRLLRHGAELRSLQRNLEVYLKNGGLPGLCFIRNAGLKRSALADLHELILARDLRLVADIRTPVSTLRRLLIQISRNPLEPYNAAEVKRTLGLSSATQAKILFAMESVFLLRRIDIPRRRKFAVILEDQLEEALLAGGDSNLLRSLETALHRNLRAQFEYSMESPWSVEIYLTRDGARVPLVFTSPENTLGVLPILGEKPSLAELRSGASFLRNYASGKIIYASALNLKPRCLDDRSLLCAAASLL